jgi:hypothetical protein
MKKFTTSLAITLFVFVTILVDTTSSLANSIAKNILPKALSSKEAFSQFCTAVSKKTGIRADWVDAFVQNIFHTKSTDLILQLFPTLTAEKVEQYRSQLLTNGILDVTKAEPVALTRKQMTQVAKAISQYLNIETEGKFVTELSKNVPLIAEKTQQPVSEVQYFCENITAYTESTVFSATALSTASKN